MSSRPVRQAHPDGVDVVFHFAGDPTALLSTVRPGGRFVSTMIQPQQLPTEGVTVIGIYTQPDPATLKRLAEHPAAGTTRVTVQDTFPLDRAPEAFASFTRGTLGKLVITIA